jgi:hypothetical protein
VEELLDPVQVFVRCGALEPETEDAVDHENVPQERDRAADGPADLTDPAVPAVLQARVDVTERR